MSLEGSCRVTSLSRAQGRRSEKDAGKAREVRRAAVRRKGSAGVGQVGWRTNRVPMHIIWCGYRESRWA